MKKIEIYSQLSLGDLSDNILNELTSKEIAKWVFSLVDDAGNPYELLFELNNELKKYKKNFSKEDLIEYKLT